MESAQSVSLRTMVARVSPDDIVIYANGALAAYLKVRKKDLVGSPLEVLARRAKGEISTCFARPESGRTSNHLVTDSEGRVFEAKSYSDGGVLDIVLDEVTTAELIGRELRASSGTPFESLNEDELRTTRHPERRYLTVSYTQLRGMSNIAERLAPMEVRLMVNSFVEEASDAVFEAGCTVGETSGDSILGIYGAPRYFADHPIRAIHAACDQMQKAANLHAGLYREGKELPPCSCGIWTGDTLVGTLGNSAWQHYTAIGTPVELAERLCNLARPGEILVPEHTLTHLLRVLPEGWEHLRAEGENEPDLSDFQWSGDDVMPVAEHLRKIVYLVGPGVKENPDRVEFYFDYLWAFRVPGRDQTVPILRVMRPSLVGDSLELSNDNVVTTQIAQTLGKYKLVEVIGIGGMGKVWRGVDRFGNSVAIKVLHSTEAVTDAQIKRFRREAEIMAKLPHRNICRVFEMNEYESIHYIAMEFVDGLSLSDLLYEKTSGETSGKSLANVDLKALISSLRSERSLRDQAESEAAERGEEPPVRPKHTRVLPVEQSLAILLKVCEAVQFAHEHGVLHRDLKPGNILLREDGEPLVADFGLAKLSSPDATRSLSMTGHVVGTLENMSPEQAESSKDVDERADVYSIGTIMYQMLTGRRHFEATGNIIADAQTLQHHEPQRLRVHNSHLDSDLEIITLKALRNDPAERYRSVAALKADIEHYRRGEVISARPISWADVTRKMIQRNKGVASVVAASIVLFVVGSMVVIFFLSRAYSAARLSAEDQRKANEQLKAKDVMVEHQREENESQKKQLEEKEQLLVEKKAELEQTSKELFAKVEQAALAEQNAKIQEERAKKYMEDVEQANKQRAETETQLNETKEKLTVATQERLEDLQNRAANPFDPNRGGFRFGGEQESMQKLQDAMKKANMIIHLELKFNPNGRPGLEADTTVKKLSEALDVLSGALLINQDFVPAWITKGEIHVALMEFDKAAESFAQASRASQSGIFPLPPGANPRELLEMANDLSRSPGDRGSRAREALDTLQDPQAGALAAAAAEIGAKAKKSLGGDLDRPVQLNETALSLLQRNSEGMKVMADPQKLSLAIWDVEDVKDLSPLKGSTLTSLTISGAKSVDFKTLQMLPLKSLELTKCSFDTVPVLPRTFVSLRALRLSGTPVTNLEFIRMLPQLEALDLSDTEVLDLSALRGFNRLRELNIAGLNPANLRVLSLLPLLETLTVSPMLVADKASLSSLRFLRPLKTVRSPDDPAQQTAADFWRKFDSGYYSEAH